MTLKMHIKSHERGLLFRHGDLVKVLGPGSHMIWSRIFDRKATETHVFSTLISAGPSPDARRVHHAAGVHG